MQMNSKKGKNESLLFYEIARNPYVE